jgi:hypothetical protein
MQVKPFVVLYAEILTTTRQQCPINAEPKKQRPATPDALMMSVAATPLSIYSKN